MPASTQIYHPMPLYGNFDFNATPLAPPGTKLVIHEKPQQQKSWSPHGVDAWYIGPAIEHYRFVKAYVPEFFSERIADTVNFLPHDIPMPSTSGHWFTLLKQLVTFCPS